MTETVINKMSSNLNGANIIIGGSLPDSYLSIKPLLESKGYHHLFDVADTDAILARLRQDLNDDVCDIDLIVIEQGEAISSEDIQHIRQLLNHYDEWGLTPIIVVNRSNLGDSEEILIDLGRGNQTISSVPFTDSALIQAIEAALLLKNERYQTLHEQLSLKDELANLKVLDARLQFLVNHDDLTGLANRRQLEEALERALQALQDPSANTESALFYIDIDSFKVLNDAEGHEAGDLLLIQVANSLRRFFEIKDVLVRIGSDEFAVLILKTSKSSAIEQAKKLSQVFDGYEFQFHGHHYQLSASIGVKVIEPMSQCTVIDILSNANQACYTAKKKGRNQVHCYHSEDSAMQTLRQSVEWASKISAALRLGHFLLKFQPIYSIAEDKVCHYECLIRMQGSDEVMYYPREFIPVAEAMGLIHQIDVWVVGKIFELIIDMPKDIVLTVNLSGGGLLDKGLFDLIKNKLDETDIDPTRIIFEITETAAITDHGRTQEMMERLHKLGCRFALDDFGAGFNSYHYLKNFPVEVVKIDGSFISNLDDDPVDQLLVKSMIDISHRLGKKAIAEFVEKESTLDLLKSYGIDMVQGRLIGRAADRIS